MNLTEIREHWQDWANKYGTSLRATTKASTLKAMEIDALSRALSEAEGQLGRDLRILEVGCGNGLNCMGLLAAHPQARFTGMDFIPEMVASANEVKRERGIPDDRLSFQVGNVLEPSFPPASFDVIFSDRCLINLNTDALQQQAIKGLAALLRPNGYLLMIENSQQTYDNQNDLREAVGLPRRSPAEFNHFFDEASLLPFLPGIGLEVLDIEDFISLHDIALYVLAPMLNGGKVDYEAPLVEAATQLNIAMSKLNPGAFGHFGQNRLYKCRKTSE